MGNGLPLEEQCPPLGDATDATGCLHLLQLAVHSDSEEEI